MASFLTRKNKNYLLLGNIGIQMGLYLRNLYYIKMDVSSSPGLILSGIFALFNLWAYLICMEEEEKNYIYKTCLSLLTLKGFFLLEIAFSNYIDIFMFFRYFFFYQLIFSFLEILLEGHFSLNPYRWGSIALFGLLLFLNSFFSEKITYLFLPGLSYTFYLFPLLYLLIKRKQIMDLGLYSYQNMVLLSLVFLLYFFSMGYFTEFWNSLDDFNEYFLILPLEGFLLVLMTRTSMLKIEVIVSYLFEGIKWFLLVVVCFLAINGLNQGSLIMSLHLSILLLLLVSFFKYMEFSNKEVEDLLVGGKETLLLEKYSQLYAERSSKFLHDSILQDIIVVNKLLERTDDFYEKEQIMELLSKTIMKIRQEMNAYTPILNPKASLNDNYYRLIKDLEKKYEDQTILVDFHCPDDLDLPYPYDFFVYKIIYELVSNLFKHSKGHYSEITIKKKEGRIFYTMVNHGDYLDLDQYKEDKNIGLRLLKVEIKRLNGTFVLENKNSMKSEEGNLTIKIEVPIDKELIYEAFINRRS